MESRNTEKECKGEIQPGVYCQIHILTAKHNDLIFLSAFLDLIESNLCSYNDEKMRASHPASCARPS